MSTVYRTYHAEQFTGKDSVPAAAEYIAQTNQAYFKTGSMTRYLNVGDWLVTGTDGSRERFTNERFEELFLTVAPEPSPPARKTRKSKEDSDDAQASD